MGRVTYLKWRHSHLENLIKSFKQNGQAEVSLNNLLNDTQAKDNIGHLSIMMKAEVIEADNTRKARFYVQYTGLLETEFPSIIGALRERVLMLLKTESSGEHSEEVLENIVKLIGLNSDIGVLEFMGYKSKKAGEKSAPVTLGVCIFKCSKDCGTFIYSISG